MARSSSAWKGVERTAAALFGTTRFPANIGGPFDFISDQYVGQVKNVERMSLALVEGLAEDIESRGADCGKVGVLVVKRSAGPGIATPHLVIFTDIAWKRHQALRGGS